MVGYPGPNIHEKSPDVNKQSEETERLCQAVFFFFLGGLNNIVFNKNRGPPQRQNADRERQPRADAVQPRYELDDLDAYGFSQDDHKRNIIIVIAIIIIIIIII